MILVLLIMLFTILQIDSAATAIPAAPQVVEQSYSLIEMCVKGGWLMLVLLVLSVIAIYIFGQKLWMTIRANKNNAYFMREISDKLQSNKRRSAMDYCDLAGTPLSATVKRGIEKIDLTDAEVKASMEAAGSHEISRLEKGLPLLASIAGGAPMIGFLGTVSGMIRAFFNMSNAGNNVDISLLSSGIYEAMVTTVGGLIVGIVAYFAYNVLVERIDRVADGLDEGIEQFMDILQQESQEQQ